MTTNPNINSMFFNPTDANEIISLIKWMKPKKSSGPDNISPCLLKQLSRQISYPLTILINKSLAEGVFPQALKTAKVIPIYKSKEKNLLNNHRPISLLSTISKIYEKIVHKRLYSFFNPMFYNRQFGFRNKHSTIQAIMEMNSDVLESLDNKQKTIATFLDLSKAFDTIDHKILLTKLKHYGIRGNPLNWFKSYLNQRTQYVSYKNNCSSKTTVTYGIPQGSVLGPLLFIIYTNDLPSCLKNSKTILFADDTTIYSTAPHLNQAYVNLNTDLNSLADWFKANKLSLNVNKTVYMVFSNNHADHDNHQFELKIGPERITRVTETRFLGIILDNKLKWNHHIKHVKTKLSSSLYAIRMAKNILASHQLKTVYNSLFQPYIDYGIILWGTATKKVIHPIQILQKRAIRLVAKANYNEHCNPLFKQINVLNIPDTHQLHVNRFMYQYHNNTLPDSLLSMFTPNRNIHRHNTQNRDNPHILTMRTASAQLSIKHTGPILWQSTPHTIQQAQTLTSFTKSYKKHLLQNY